MAQQCQDTNLARPWKRCTRDAAFRVIRYHQEPLLVCGQHARWWRESHKVEPLEPEVSSAAARGEHDG